MDYMLFVNDIPTKSNDSFEDAKLEADLFPSSDVKLRIESLVSQVKSRIWNYDYESKSWIEQI